MKKLELYFDIDDFKLLLGKLSILGLCSISPIFYYSFEDKSQVMEAEMDFDHLDTFLDEQGHTCCNFLPGEHRIIVSRNDFLRHEMDSVDGYTIESVITNSWKDNCQVIYVNIEPVVVQGTIDKNGEINFNDFGEVISNSFEKRKFQIK